LRIFRIKGTSEEILRGPAFTNLLVETVFKKHIEEILSDPAFVRRARSDCRPVVSGTKTVEHYSMKTYGHLFQSHSQEIAAKVKF
jgi:hypothetical protein